ncbi:FG-GAP-like repeat-containing protein [Hymenobacter sp. BT770]|uniref:FG-GAP-like repeat-containing protein n=1 Tax=Hymenobacter sp. BT770 TaxID=2886942 RepID=UPI001D12FFA3|nr:FG-GAP-like repeat-containing protein [Hymenobacter sp. BT770]MCC3152844.1 FG-GAP-like repeat-containing protein [Hymenobacter sp. BT770]MDO3414919.1 FG-GAP-like repeat-containing protein [Hymenobacter sp. BT770]
MKLSTLFAGLLCAAPALAQTPISFAPAQNASAAPRNTAVAVTLSAPAGPGAATGLKVFSAQSGGKKSGTTTVNGNTISFAPSNPFLPGETVTATLANGASVPQVWQFTAAATGGSGAFSSSSTLSIPSSASTVASPMRMADVDGDGDLDLLTFNLSVQYSSPPPPLTGNLAITTGMVKVHLNNGVGAFTTISSVSLAPEDPYSGGLNYRPALDVADIDADGDLDILVSSVLAQVFVLVNNGTGAFTLASTIKAGAANSNSLVTGDIDGDGDLDYISTTQGLSSHTYTFDTSIGINDGGGNFTIGASGNFSGAYYSIIKALKDIDGDGALDAVGTDATGVWLYAWLNNGSGSFSSAHRLNDAGDNISSWALGDYDADGDLDLAVVAYTNCSSCGRTVKIMANDGTGNFSNNGLPVYPYSGQLSSADINGDGRIDLLLTGYGFAGRPADTLKVMRNLGNGNFGRPQGYAIPNNDGTIVTGDVDGDGDIDVVASTYATSTLAGGTNTMLNGLGAVLGTAALTASSFAVWPNPASAASVLHVTLPVPASHATLRLATVLGQTVHTQSFTGNAANIVSAGLASGVYLLTVQVEDQAPLTRRVAVE